MRKKNRLESGGRPSAGRLNGPDDAELSWPPAALSRIQQEFGEIEPCP